MKFKEPETWKQIDRKYEINDQGVVRTRKMGKPRKRYFSMFDGKFSVYINNEKYYVEDLVSKYFFPVEEKIHNLSQYLDWLCNKKYTKSGYNQLIKDQESISYAIRVVHQHFEDIFDEPLTEEIQKHLDSKYHDVQKITHELEKSKEIDIEVEPDVEYIPLTG